MNLDSLFSTVHLRADALFPETLLRILDATIPEAPANCCQKCGVLLRTYVHYRLALHRMRRREYLGPRINCTTALQSRMEMAREDFHSASCECGLQLWRGYRWREKQDSSYQHIYNVYRSNQKDSLQ